MVLFQVSGLNYEFTRKGALSPLHQGLTIFNVKRTIHPENDMVTASRPPPQELEIIVRLDPAVAERAEAVARQNDYANLSAALAAMTQKMSLERRMPGVAADDNERAGVSYSGASFSRLAVLARQSGREAVAATLAAGKSVSFERASGDGARQYPVVPVVKDVGRAR